MIIIILLIICAVLLGVSMYFDWDFLGGASGACFVCAVLACFIIPAVSYDTYVDLKANYVGVIAQYGQAVTLYEDKAIITINEKTFTDFRYEGYQKQMGDFIMDLRNSVTKYNMAYTAKSLYNDNILWGWLIINVDEDMKLLQLNEQVN